MVGRKCEIMRPVCNAQITDGEQMPQLLFTVEHVKITAENDPFPLADKLFQLLKLLPAGRFLQGEVRDENREIIFEGKGQPPYISFFVEYTAVGADYARYDADYDALTN